MSPNDSEKILAELQAAIDRLNTSLCWLKCALNIVLAVTIFTATLTLLKALTLFAK